MGILQSTGLSPQMTAGKERVNTIRVQNGVEETVVFERAGMKVRMLDTKALEKRNKLSKKSNTKTLYRVRNN